MGREDERVRERRGTHLFRDLVHRAGRPQDKGPKMAEDRWRRMLGGGAPGDGPWGSEGNEAKAQAEVAEGAAAEGGAVLKGTRDKAISRLQVEGEGICTGDKMKSPAQEG